LSLTIFYHPDFLNHDTGNGHPERSDRLTACISAINSADFGNQLEWKYPHSATEEELRQVHTAEHIQSIKDICNSGGGYLEPDTPVCKESYKIALKSSGAWIDGISEINKGNSVFVLSRPPGHHAEINKAMGFCLFSNAALAAVSALKKNNIDRVTIFDWDVHHGNGTQNIVKNNPNIFYVSTHQFPFYPGTGSQIETGKYNNILNIPLNEGIGSIEFRKYFDDLVYKFIQNSKPDLIIISAGFDAHYRDPLASINLTANDFSYMTKRLLEIKPQLLIGLEGGYDLRALGECSLSVVKELVK
jgi:acetoin utilization deacetylase AcuC-like enzyme